MVTSTARPELLESAARIREAMQALGLNHKDVARELGSKDPQGTAVRNWIRGSNTPTPAIRERLAQLLGLEPNDLAPTDWVARPGQRKPKDEDKDAFRQRRREIDSAYRQRRRAQPKEGGPAAQAVALAAELGHARGEGAPRRVTDAETVFATNLRADGTMQIKLNLMLPAAAGVALVQMLYAADALKLATTQGDKMRELDAELLAGSRAEARGDDRV